MNLELFEKERQLIGEGYLAKVFLWNNSAYKVFKEDYPNDWIDYEVHIQKQVNTTSLPVVSYKKQDNLKMIQMEYLNGIVLTDRMRKEKYKQGVEDLITIQKEIHKEMNCEVPRLIEHIQNKLNELEDPLLKMKAIEYLNRFEDSNALCHLDLHPSNLMYVENQYYIIDWVNAKRGNPIFDFARTYVILYEHAFRLSQKYMSLLKKDRSISLKNIEEAIFIMSLLRLQEHESERVKELIKIYNR